jgi:HD-GYP domain-containing protein (c-di-GMP phosphodiesterase class II)
MSKNNKKKQQAQDLPSSHDGYRSLVDIGIALSAEKELDKILDLILDKALEATQADAASIYLTESIKIDSIGNAAKKFHPVLRFHRSSNRLTGRTVQNKILDIDASIAGYVSSTGNSVRVDDCYVIPPNSPFIFNADSDKETGYRTKSMLAVPMRSATGKVRGVLQLINKLTPEAATGELEFEVSTVVPFSNQDEELMRAFASQACVAIDNAKLTEDIENLFESFIRASVTAIEARDPATSGHSDRVAVLTVELARAVHQCNHGPFKHFCFSDEQVREIRYAALLHDFGKIGVRESVLAKQKKLYPHEMDTILLRLDNTQLRQEMLAWRDMAHELIELFDKGELQNPHFKFHQTQRKIDKFGQQLTKIKQGIYNANEPQVIGTDFDINELIQWIDQNSKELSHTILTPEEFMKLSVPKGTLSEEERREIESHVSHTYQFLKQIAWTEDLADIPDIAHAHHEKCDGTGYPRGLTCNHIPVQARIMTIADIYDALTAMDRPYKRSVSPERAIDILSSEAKARKIDADLLQIFIEAGIFRSVAGMLRSRKSA